MLDFADLSEPHEAQVVEYITPIEKEEDEENDDFESEQCIIDNEGAKVH